MARAASFRERHRQAIRPTRLAAPTPTITPAAISKTRSSSAAASRTGPASFTASAAPMTTSTAVPMPLPPLPWVWAPSGIPMTVLLLLVPGGGLPPVADPAGEPVNGARAGALHPLESLAAGADRAAPGPALDVAGALALGAGAERGQVQEPHPQGDDGEHGQDQVGAHRGSPVPAADRPGGVASGIAVAVTGGLALGAAFGPAGQLAVDVALLVDAAGEPLAVLVLAGLVEVLLACIGQHPHGVPGARPGRREPPAATAQASAGVPVAAVAAAA